MEPKELLKKYNLDGLGRREKLNHFDSITINHNDKGSLKKTNEGFLKGDAPVAQVGIMSYIMEDGSVLKEFVPPETLFNIDSMDSLHLKPVTNQHPAEKRVTSENAAFRQVGTMGENVRQDGKLLMSNMVVTDDMTVEDVEGGVQELSPGYTAEVIFEKGEFEGQKFDAIQTRRTYNHVAVVDHARGGSEIRLQLDKADAVGYHSGAIKDKKDSKQKSKPIKKEKRPMANLKIDNIDYEADQEVINHSSKLQARADKAETELKEKTDAVEKMTAERDALKEKHDKLEKQDNKEEIQTAVKARINLERVANDVLDEKELEKVDSMEDRELKIKIILDKMPGLEKKIDDKTTDTYLDALMEAISVGEKKDGDKDNLGSQRQTTTTKQDNKNKNKNDGDDPDPDAARERMLKNDEDAWKKSEPVSQK